MSKVLTYATVCSGVECFSAAAIGLPFRPVFFSEIEPFPCAVLRHRFPHVPNLGDMGKIKVNEKGEITNGRTTVTVPGGRLDILAGGTPCFAGGTMVLTPRGYVPIETIKVGDEVVSGSGHARKVTAVGNKLAAVGAFHALGRPEIICTPNHPFMCVSVKTDHRLKSETHGSKITIGEYVETRADESVGKYVGRVNCMRGTAYAITFPKCYNASVGDMMELAGWYLGDGYIRRFKGRNKKCVVFALCSEKKIAAFRSRFGGKVSFTVCKDGKISMSCTAFADWLIFHFGEHSDRKRIPFWCYDRETTSRLVEGYVATDGTTQGSMTRFSTVSPALAYGIADILGHASVCKQKTPDTYMIEGRTVRQRDCYVVSWCHNTTHRTKFMHTRYASIVRSYHGTNGIARVYNITVEEEHTYIANGLYTHNCQDVSNAGRRRGMREGSGTRSSLAFEFVRLIRELRPRYVVWENVAGVLSDESFPKFLCAIADCGYGVAYRTLDAQFVRCADIDLPDGGVVRLERAVPQRRRRVWALGCAGEDLRRASEILFEPRCVCGDRPPRRVTWQGTAEASRGRARLPDGVVGRASGFDPYEPGGVKSLNPGLAGTLINGSCPGCRSGVVEMHGVSFDGGFGFPVERESISGTLHNNTCPGHCNGVVEAYENHAQDCRVKPCGEVAPTIGASNANGVGTGGNNPLVVSTSAKVGHAECFGINANGVTKTAQMPCREECAETLAVGHRGGVLVPNVAAMRYVVRRLTPTECERLMGLPDGWTLPAFAPDEITDALVDEFRRIHDTFGAVMAGYAGKNPPKPKAATWVRKWLERIANPRTCPDAPRYKACGNGMCTNQVRWIFLMLLHAEGVDPWEDRK